MYVNFEGQRLCRTEYCKGHLIHKRIVIHSHQDSILLSVEEGGSSAFLPEQTCTAYLRLVIRRASKLSTLLGRMFHHLIRPSEDILTA